MMRKKRCLGLMNMLIAVFLVLLFSVPVFAENDTLLILDDASVLSEEEYAELYLHAYDITEKYECAVHIVTIDDPDLDMNSIQQFSESLYLSSDQFGYGPSKDGFMLVVNVSERCYWLLAYGDFGNMALTDYGKEIMSEEFLDDFSFDDWPRGFQDYLNFSEQVLEMAVDGAPLDKAEQPASPLTSYGIGAFFALIVSFITCESFKGKMLTAVKSSYAHHYIDMLNTNIEFRNDRFAYRTTTRSKIQSSKSKEGGTTVNKKGFSGKGGKF